MTLLRNFSIFILMFGYCLFLSSCGVSGSSGVLSIANRWRYDAGDGVSICTGATTFGIGSAGCITSGRITVFSDGSSEYSLDVSFDGSGGPGGSYSNFLPSPASSYSELVTAASANGYVLSIVVDTKVSPPTVTLNFGDKSSNLNASLARTFTFVAE